MFKFVAVYDYHVGTSDVFSKITFEREFDSFSDACDFMSRFYDGLSVLDDHIFKSASIVEV